LALFAADVNKHTRPVDLSVLVAYFRPCFLAFAISEAKLFRVLAQAVLVRVTPERFIRLGSPKILGFFLLVVFDLVAIA
jgi:hypothetical protein